MGNAIAAKLGMKANFTEVTFDDMVTGISTNKYDAGIGRSRTTRRARASTTS